MTGKLLKDRMRAQVRKVGTLTLFAAIIFKTNSIKLKILIKIIGNSRIFHIRLINETNTSN